MKEEINLVILEKIYCIECKIGSLAKKADNPFFHSKYLQLDKLQEALQPLLKEFGLGISSSLKYIGDGVYDLETYVSDKENYMVFHYAMTPSKSDPQGIGSLTSYCRRYSLCCIFNIKQEDDDAESAMNRGSKQQPKQQTTRQWGK